MAKVFSKDNRTWNFNIPTGFWIGGRHPASNLSQGFHGILKQWWDFYSSQLDSPHVLLVSENLKVKEEFHATYPTWTIDVIDLFTELQNESNVIVADICKEQLEKKYDLIINQANLEHMYDPFGAMRNLTNSLNSGGYMITHTHAQNFHYHQFPRDYIRFMIDWWYDLPQQIENIELLELYEDDNSHHVFTCYKKL